ncbi:MAG TPA: hypothetical protein VF203_04520 [Burkholderiales bacterium]
MIGVLILGHKDFAEGIIKAIEHTYGRRPPGIEVAGVDYSRPPEEIETFIRRRLARADRGDGVLILADIYGTTHTNVARRLLKAGRVELISGASLPMVLRALTYRRLKMPDLIDRALAGGYNGIICATNPKVEARSRRKERR